MFRRSLLLLCLLVSSLTLSAAVHARELPGNETIECSGYVHSDGDADQSPPDNDRQVAHHHGVCHGAAAFVAAKAAQIETVARTADITFALISATLGRWSPGPDLRPPIA